LGKFFDHTNGFIDGALQDNSKAIFFIHCFAGISRSSTVLSAYLMHSKGVSREEALEMIRANRAKCNPNSGFVEQLKQYENKLKRLAKEKS